MTLKVAVSGLGQGRNHVRTFQQIDDTEVVGIYDPDDMKAAQRAKDFGIKTVYATFEDLTRDPDVDIVSIAAPCPYHGVQALAALNAGKHVLVEVGLDGFDLDRLWSIVKAAEIGHLKVQVGNHMRWDPQTLAMRGLVENGKIGEVFYAESEYLHNLAHLMGAEQDGTATWRNGFGKPTQPSIASGGGIHAIDTIRWILGNVEFVEVTGYGNRIVMPHRDVDDLEVALFKTATGAVVRVVVAKGIHRTSSQSYGVYGTRGSAEKPRSDGTGPTFGGDLRPIRFWAAEQEDEHSEAPVQQITVEPHQVDPELKSRIGHGGLTYFEARDLVDAIMEDRQPLINVYEGARSSAAGICAWRAIREGRPIRIPPFPDRSVDYARFAPIRAMA